PGGGAPRRRRRRGGGRVHVALLGEQGSTAGTSVHSLLRVPCLDLSVPLMTNQPVTPNRHHASTTSPPSSPAARAPRPAPAPPLPPADRHAPRTRPPAPGGSARRVQRADAPPGPRLALDGQGGLFVPARVRLPPRQDGRPPAGEHVGQHRPGDLAGDARQLLQ